MRVYVAENAAAKEINDAIEEFFRNFGWEVRGCAISQIQENKVPADYIYPGPQKSGQLKLFGIQYKALYFYSPQNKRECWFLSKRQHSTLLNFPWIVYGLSLMRTRLVSSDPNYFNWRQRILFGDFRILEPQIIPPFQSRQKTLRTNISGLMPWFPSFFIQLIMCCQGKKTNLKEVYDLIGDARGEGLATDIEQDETYSFFLLNMEFRKVWVFRSELSNT